MDYDQLIEFLSQYGYYIMLPLMILEGPIVTVISAFFAKAGAFNIVVVLILSILGDILGDIIMYYLGYYLGDSFVNKLGKYIGINHKLVSKIKKYFKKHGGKTIFIVKSTTGLCWATFATAGMVKMDFKKFLKFSVLGGLVWSGFLVTIGYFYGYMWEEIDQYIRWAGWVVFLLAVLTVLGIQVFKKRTTLRLNGNQKSKAKS